MRIHVPGSRDNERSRERSRLHAEGILDQGVEGQQVEPESIAFGSPRRPRKLAPVVGIGGCDNDAALYNSTLSSVTMSLSGEDEGFGNRSRFGTSESCLSASPMRRTTPSGSKAPLGCSVGGMYYIPPTSWAWGGSAKGSPYSARRRRSRRSSSREMSTGCAYFPAEAGASAGDSATITVDVSGLGLPPETLSDAPPQWSNRHHVLTSRANASLPRGRRAYFDTLPQVHVVSGEYIHMPNFTPLDDASGMPNLEVRWRVQPPLQKRPPRLQTFVSGDVLAAGAKAAAAASAAAAEAAAQAAVEAAQAAEAAAAAQAEAAPYCSEGDPEATVEEKLVRRRTVMLRETRQASRESGSTRRSTRSDSDVEEEVVSVSADATDSCSPSRTRVSVTKSDGAESGTPRRLSKNTTLKRRSTRALGMDMAEAHSPLVQAFATWCKPKFGHLVRLFRILDKDGNMKLSKQEFQTGLKELGYPGGDVNGLWKALDKDHTNWISFTHFAMDLSYVLARFKQWATKEYGTVVGAFRAFDTQRDGKLTFQEFSNACNKTGFTATFPEISIRQVFDLMDDAVDQSSMGRLTENEVKFLDNWDCPEYIFEEVDADLFDRFREILLARYGDNALLAWRKALDKDASMRVSYYEFTATVKKLEKAGHLSAEDTANIPALFRSIDARCDGFISLQEWDLGAHRLLTTFASWAKEKYGKVSNLAKVAMEKDSDEKRAAGKDTGVKYADFRRLVQAPLDLEQEEVFQLFCGLSLEGKQGRISQSELMFLDHWDYEDEQKEELHWHLMLQRLGF